MRTLQYLLGALFTLGAPAALAADSTIAISGYVRDNACAVAGESKDLALLQIVGGDKLIIPFC